jgi:hypothetical protein
VEATANHLLGHVMTTAADTVRDARHRQIRRRKRSEHQMRSIAGGAYLLQPPGVPPAGESRLEGEVHAALRQFAKTIDMIRALRFRSAPPSGCASDRESVQRQVTMGVIRPNESGALCPRYEGDDMSSLGDLADWWDTQHEVSEEILNQFVDDHPNWFGIAVATTASTMMTLGAGLVDVLRLGEGMSEGSLSGLGRDGLRLLQVSPAVGQLSRLRVARLVKDPGGEICTWVTATKALRQVGAKLFASMDDLARAAGLSTSQLSGAFVDTLAPVLQKLGARVKLLGTPPSLQAVNEAIKGRGVVMFSVLWRRGADDVGHTLYAFRDLLGRVRYADRTGLVVSTLDELERFYRGIASAKVYGTAALVEGPRILLADGLAVLGLEIRALLTVDADTARQSLYVRSRAATGTLPLLREHVTQRGDSLAQLAQRYYGDRYKWPVLYGANRKTIGPDPSSLKVGLRISVPVLPKVELRQRRASRV